MSFYNHRSCRIGNRPVSDERAHQERTGEAKRRRGKHTGTKMRNGGSVLHESEFPSKGNSSYMQQTTERIMLFGKISNSISVHTGKELP